MTRIVLFGFGCEAYSAEVATRWLMSLPNCIIINYVSHILILLYLILLVNFVLICCAIRNNVSSFLQKKKKLFLIIIIPKLNNSKNLKLSQVYDLYLLFATHFGESHTQFKIINQNQKAASWEFSNILRHLGDKLKYFRLITLQIGVTSK